MKTAIFKKAAALKKVKNSNFIQTEKNVQKSINVQGQIRSCRVEVESKLNKVCSTFIRHTRVFGREIY